MTDQQLFKSSEPFIKTILAKYPETRGNDLLLIFKVWGAQGVRLSEEQKQMISKCYSPETIRRTRQKIQETGLFRPIKIIEQQRNFLQEEYRKELSKDNEA